MIHQRIGFGGGCHWCTEAVFQALRGIRSVEQGFIQSQAPHEAFSEAVQIEFDSADISLAALVEIHLRTHASTSNHKMRGKYRSAVYTFTAEQNRQVKTIMDGLQPEFDAPLVTQALPFIAFKASDERFQNYSRKNPEGQFCKSYIDPKLALLRTRYQKFLSGENI